MPGTPVWLDGLAGLLLTGGVDVDPQLYGQEPHAMTQEPDRSRDEMELAALERALQAGLPVLAICRGAQLLNVKFGGTLCQHLPNPDVHEQRNPDEIPRKHRDAHEVEISAGTRLETIIGARRCAVNSRHHQAVDRVGDGLEVSARSITDGVVEGLELPSSRFVVAVQWHPEDRIEESSPDRRLFDAFSAAVRGR
jgi:putative glutamine amidotransferase